MRTSSTSKHINRLNHWFFSAFLGICLLHTASSCAPGAAVARIDYEDDAWSSDDSWSEDDLVAQGHSNSFDSEMNEGTATDSPAGDPTEASDVVSTGGESQTVNNPDDEEDQSVPDVSFLFKLTMALVELDPWILFIHRQNPDFGGYHPGSVEDIGGEDEDPCIPDCDGRECGADGCEGSCGECSEDQFCNHTVGLCEEVVPVHWETIEPAGLTAQRIVSLAIASGGFPSQAMDVDGDSSTCAPNGSCDSGCDSQLSTVFQQMEHILDVNGELEASIADESSLVAFVAPGWNEEGQPFSISVFFADFEPECTSLFDPTCECQLQWESLNPTTGTPRMEIHNARVIDGVLTAGGMDQTATVVFPLSEDIFLELPLRMVQLEADIDGEMSDLQWKNGRIGFVLNKEEITAAIESVPEGSDFDSYKSTATNLVDMLVQPDIDSNGDGELDSASLGLAFETLHVNVTGFVL